MERILLVSVGGSSEPIIKTITNLKPKYICWFCSQESCEQIKEIKSNVNQEILKKVSVDYKIITDNCQELIPCYIKANECVKKIQEWKTKEKEIEIFVDYTGGTKTMAVTIAFIGARNGWHFSYIGGSQRDKDNLGIVIDGKEEIFDSISPWSLFALDEQKLFSIAFNNYQFISAIEIAQQVLEKNELDTKIRNWFEILLNLAEAYHSWELSNYKDSKYKLGKICGTLKDIEVYISNENMINLIKTVEENKKFLDRLLGETNNLKEPTLILVQDIISDAKRRDKEGKYDDSVARIYRALEMIGQIELKKETGAESGKFPIDKIPVDLKDEYEKYKDKKEPSLLRLGMYATFKLLNKMNNELGKQFMANYERKIEGLMNSRNQSKLAHGTISVGKETCENMFNLIEDIFNIKPEVDFPKLPLIFS